MVSVQESVQAVAIVQIQLYCTQYWTVGMLGGLIIVYVVAIALGISVLTKADMQLCMKQL